MKNINIRTICSFIKSKRMNKLLETHFHGNTIYCSKNDSNILACINFIHSRKDKYSNNILYNIIRYMFLPSLDEQYIDYIHLLAELEDQKLANDLSTYAPFSCACDKQIHRVMSEKLWDNFSSNYALCGDIKEDYINESV